MGTLEKLKAALRINSTQRILLFTGAGYSYQAENRLGEAVPMGNGLRDALLDKTPHKGDKSTVSLESAAQYANKKIFAPAVLELLKDLFTVRATTPAMQTIAAKRWLRVYTTNFDDGYEKCFELTNKELNSVTVDDHVSAIRPTGQTYVHLNGSIRRLDYTNLDSSIRLSRRSYIIDSPQRRAWASQLGADLESSVVRIFVGYSLADPDVTSLIPQDSLSRERTFFICSPDANDIEDAYLQDFGSVLRIGTDRFAKLLDATQSVDTASSTSDIRNRVDADFLAGHRYGESSAGVEDVFKLAWTGQVDRRFLPTRSDDSSYVIPRTNWVWNDFDPRTNGRNLLIVKGGLGTGKSVLLEQIGADAIRFGVDAAFLSSMDNLRLRQLDAMLRLQLPFVLLVDGYAATFSFLEKSIASRCPENALVVVAERSNTHDFSFGTRLLAAFAGWNVREIDLDIMTADEISKFAVYLNASGLVGDLANSQLGLEKTIRQELGAYLPNVLIHSINSPAMKTRVGLAADFLRENSPRARYCTLVLILQSMGLPTTSRTLTDLAGGLHVPPNVSFTDEHAGVLFGVSRGRVFCVSTIFGQYILSDVLEPSMCIDIIKQALDSAVDLRHVNPECQTFADILVRTSTIQKIFRTERSLAHAQDIFDYARTHSYYSNKPLFWLQYAIWAYVCEQWDFAEGLFKTAFAKAKSDAEWDAYQIDNHYARFRVARALAKDMTDPAEAEDELRKAMHVILEQTGKNDNEHFPYRVASSVKSYFDRYHELFTDEFRTYILTTCELVLNRALALEHSLRTHDDVIRCIRSLKQLLGKFKS
jgi:hypothetical protein